MCSARPSSVAHRGRTPSPRSTPRPSLSAPAATAPGSATLVGRVSAHEIGHLLLGTNAHATHGLMRASWDVTRIDRGDWDFTVEDATAIRRRLQPTAAVLVARAGS